MNRSAVSAEEVEGARRRTLSLSVFEGSVWAFMWGFGEMYVAPFAVFLKASNTAMGFLASMPPLLGALAQMAGAAFTDRFRKRRALIVPMAVAQALLFLPLFFVAYFFRGVAVPSVLLFAAAAVICNSAAIPAWTSMMGDVVPEKQRGDYFGKRGRMIILMIFTATLMAGGILHLFQKAGLTWAGFGILFVLASLARLTSARLLHLHYDPPYAPEPDAYFSFWDFIRRTRYSNFTRFAIYFAMMMGAANIAAPFFTVYMLRDLEWSYAQFTISQAVFLSTQFIFIRWWGRIGDRHGNRVVIATTAFIISILPLLWTVSTGYFYLLCVQMTAGVGWSGFSIAAQNFTFDAVTPQKRARIASYTSLLNGVSTLLGGAVIGAWLANHLPAVYRLGGLEVRFLSSLPAVFAMSALMRFAATLVMLSRFKEVREAEAIHPVRLILRLAGGQVIAGFFSGASTRVAASLRGRKGRDGSDLI